MNSRLLVDLRSSTSFFLEFITSYLFSAVPRHAVEAARKRNAESTWTEPSCIVYQRTVHATGLSADTNESCWSGTHATTMLIWLRLEELTFLPVVDGTTVMNLYKAGDAAADSGPGPVHHYLLRFSAARKIIIRRRDSEPSFRASAHDRAPFDNVLLRYALNMATDKKALNEFLWSRLSCQPGRLSRHCRDIASRTACNIDVDGRVYDVLVL